MHRGAKVFFTSSLAFFAACSSASDASRPGNPFLEGARGEQAAGTGTRDVVATDARSSFAKSAGVGWWEVELRLLDDDVDATGVISTADSTRVAIDFWAHADDGKVKANGRFAIDVVRWLSLGLERDPSDLADVFEGSDVKVAGAAVPAIERAAWLSALLAELKLEAATGSTSSALSTDASLASCVGADKSGLKKALSSVSTTFSTCAECAASASDPGGDAAWKACGACEGSLADATKAGGLFDVLACKMALVVPGGGFGDADDAGGPLVKVPASLASATCYAKSTDKVHGTFRITDGKGGVSCGDCPAGTVPADSKLGCEPSAADESKALVLVPTASGRPPTPRVISSDACITVDVTGTGTVNGLPISKGPDRLLFKIGEGARGWGELPKLAGASYDQWDLTSNTHSGSSQGKFAVGGPSKTDKRKVTYKGTVAEAIARGGCSSRPVFGLSSQIVEELARCVKPDFMVQVPSGGRLVNDADHRYLEKPAAEALVRALGRRAGTLHISSMYRTIAQQYFLYQRAACFSAVAPPGRSNHETGIAIDVSDPDNSSWRSALEGSGFQWLGSWDRFHFDYKGAGSTDLRGLDVKAFQRLWNRNNPGDVLAEDGVWNGETEKRLRASPAAGFPIGVPDSCASAQTAPTSKGSREPHPFLTNVTVANLFPGSGCTTGKDASHESVDACLTSTQVCEPFWCDLADQRAKECR